MIYSRPVRVGCVVGTRPEVIKMAPIIHQLKLSSWASVSLINTAQHRKMVDNMLDVFNLHPDVDLDVMKPDQSLAELTATLCQKLDLSIKKSPVDILLAAGDTTTVFVSSLVSFYNHIPFAHVEAGLRTYNLQEPFPEEINRVITAPLSDWHFAPTVIEKENLLRENIPESKIFVTGNTVIDALFWTLKNKPSHSFQDLSNIVVVTVHRREHSDEELHSICAAIKVLAQRFEHINFVLPVHPSPRIQKNIEALLFEQSGVHLIPPVNYDEFAGLLKRCLFVLTDSGGIQEEAPALGKPVLVLRNTTERPAIISEGVGILIGSEEKSIIDAVSLLLSDKQCYDNMSKGISPYGDGHSAYRIVNFLKDVFGHSL